MKKCQEEPFFIAREKQRDRYYFVLIEVYISLITRLAKVNPKIAVICANVPLIRAFRASHPDNDTVASGREPWLPSTSSLKTQRNFFPGNWPFFNFRRKAAANGHPCTFLESL